MPERRWTPLALALAGTLLAGCLASPPRTPSGEIAFVDFDTFDRTLSSEMRGGREVVTVRFPNQPTKVNDLPPRLSKWLSAVQRHGGGVRVEAVAPTGEDELVEKSAMVLLSALISGYRLVQNSLPALLGRRYAAVIRLEDRSGTVERIEFVRAEE